MPASDPATLCLYIDFTWKARVRAETERRDIPAGALRERDLRDLFIGNATPEQAADRAALEAHNARPPFGRKRV